MNITKLFYLLFFIDILIAVIVGIFTDYIFGLITGFVLLFINGITFYFIQKILKIGKQTYENRKQV